MKYTVYYSVHNGGDGSAYPVLFESEELCEWDQDHLYEGWGESCNGQFEFESDSPITCLDHIITKEEYLKQLEDRLTYTSRTAKIEEMIRDFKEVFGL